MPPDRQAPTAPTLVLQAGGQLAEAYIEPEDDSKASTRLEDRVQRAAEAALAARSYVSAVDVLLRLGWLAPPHFDLWRQGRVECLERVVQASLGKQSRAMRTLRVWAGRRGLKPSETGYVARTGDRRRLRFSVSGNADIERAYRTHWVAPELSAGKRNRGAWRREGAPDRWSSRP